MTTPLYAQLVSGALVRRLRAAPPPPPPSLDARASAIAAVERAIVERARKRRVFRWTASIAASAALFLVAFGVSHHLALRAARIASASAREVQIVAHPAGGGASVVVSGAEAPLSDGRALPVGSRIVTPPNGRATLAFSTGTGVAVGEGTDMTVAGEGAVQVLRLDAGSIDLHVAKTGSKFLVQTPDSEVEVRGTQFRVSVVSPDESCGAGAKTRVAVTEGLVVVRHEGIELRIAAGEQWPSGCVRLASLASSMPPNTRGGAWLPASTLADQNNLYQSAVAIMRAGDAQGAVAGFDRFLAKYPSSHLTESAIVQRMRLQRTIAPGRAVTNAREYLAVYPNGFARSEAEAIVSGIP